LSIGLTAAAACARHSCEIWLHNHRTWQPVNAQK
jgi:hypothetical protein